MLKVELHAHTRDDPHDRIPHSATDLIDRAASLGYDALAITLHERQLDIRDLVDYDTSRGVLLIRGMERSISGRHIRGCRGPRCWPRFMYASCSR